MTVGKLKVLLEDYDDGIEIHVIDKEQNYCYDTLYIAESYDAESPDLDNPEVDISIVADF